MSEMAEKRAVAAYAASPLTTTIKHLVTSSGGAWSGTMTDLFEEVALLTGEYPATDPKHLSRLVGEYRRLLLDKDGIITLVPNSSRKINGRSMKIYTFRQKNMTDEKK